MKEVITNNIKREILRSEIEEDVCMRVEPNKSICYEKIMLNSKEIVIKLIVNDTPYFTKEHQTIPWEIELFQYDKDVPEEEIISFLNWVYPKLELWDEDKFQNVVACFYCVGCDDSYIVRYFNMQPIGKKNGQIVYYWRNDFSPKFP